MGAPAKDRGFEISFLDAAQLYFANLKRQSHQMLSGILTIMTLSTSDPNAMPSHLSLSLPLRHYSALF
jgi:hypothetical protein